MYNVCQSHIIYSDFYLRSNIAATTLVHMIFNNVAEHIYPCTQNTILYRYSVLVLVCSTINYIAYIFNKARFCIYIVKVIGIHIIMYAYIRNKRLYICGYFVYLVTERKIFLKWIKANEKPNGINIFLTDDWLSKAIDNIVYIIICYLYVCIYIYINGI